MFFFKTANKRDARGNILLFSIVFGVISFSIIVTAISSYAIFENRASVFKHNTEQAFHVAEAGIAYYRWHLAHDDDDFQDGMTTTGPYVHDFYDAEGNVVGHYSLEITPPDAGTTAVEVESTGWLERQPDSQRTIRARLTPVSLTDYAYVLGTGAWVKEDMIIHGKFHANGGIRFDGTGDAPITSAVASYSCRYSHGCFSWWGETKPGIWGDGGPEDFWEFPVPAKDISAITPKRSMISEAALADGLYLPSSGAYGWHFNFKNNGTIDVSKVNKVDCYLLMWSPLKHSELHHRFWWWSVACYDIKQNYHWGTYDMPNNNFIFVNDNVWVDGIVDGRATLAVADGKNIVINDNIVYREKDGNHVLALVAEEDILIPRNCPADLEINAVMASQEGAVMRHYYWPWGWWGGPSEKGITTYGSIISQEQWIWYYPSAWFFWSSGYQHTTSTYDTNLTTNPPPGFPFTAEYQVVDWEEVIE